MSEINAVFEKSSKQLLSLVHTLKNHTALQDQITDTLAIRRNVKAIKKKLNNKFSDHPEPLSSESELSESSVKNGFSDAFLHSVPKKNFFEEPFNDHNVFSLNQNDMNVLEHSISARNSDDFQIQTALELSKLKKVNDKSENKKEMWQSKSLNKLKNGTIHKMKMPSRGAESLNFQKSPKSKLASPRRNIDPIMCSAMQKTLHYMENIKMIMAHGIEPPDGEQGWERTRVRTVEFASRYSRNYLYQLERKMIDLHDLITSFKNTPSNAANVHRQLLSAHQSIIQALMAYHNHMTTLMANVLLEKLQYVVEQTTSLCNMHKIVMSLDKTGSTKREALVDILLKKSNIFLDRVLEAIERRNAANSVSSSASKYTLLGYNMNNLRKPAKMKQNRKTGLQSRLSMYSISSYRKDMMWKKAFDKKDKLKLNNVQSRYKTCLANKQHEKPSIVDVHVKSKLQLKKASGLLRNTPISTPVNEDNILTMVELQKQKENGAEKNVNIKSIQDTSFYQEQPNGFTNLHALVPLIQEIHGQLQNNNNNNNQAMTQMGLLLNSLLGMVLDERINSGEDKECGQKRNDFANHKPHNHVINAMLENIQQKTQEKENRGLNKAAPDKPCESAASPRTKEAKSKSNLTFETGVLEINNAGNMEEPCKIKQHNAKPDRNSEHFNKPKKKQTITVTGARNAQLICIRDDDCVIEAIDTLKTNTSSEIKSKEATAIQTENQATEGDKMDKKPHSKSAIKSNEKSFKKLVLLPKQHTFNIVQYKILYSKFGKKNYMYRKTSQLRPWEIVNSIADHLMNDLLLTVAREIEVEPLLKGLFKAEFQ